MFKGNRRPHIPIYYSTGRDVVLMIDDDKEKHVSELLRQIQPLLTGFLLIGVDLRPQCTHKSLKNNSFRETVIKISHALIHIASWVFVLLIMYGIFSDKSSQTLKQDIAVRGLTILTIFLRSVLYWRHKDILKTLTHLSDAYEKINLKSKNLNKGFVSALFIVYIGVFISMYGTVLLVLIAKGEIFIKYFIQRKYYYVTPSSLPLYVYYLFLIVDFMLFLINCMSIGLFIILLLAVCTALKLILRDYRKSISSSRVTFEVLQRRYTTVMGTVNRVDKCLSFPLFIILGMHILLLFFVVSFYDWRQIWIRSVSVMEIYFCVIFIFYIGQYCAMTIFAARIHDEVQNIKIEVAKMSSRSSQLTAVEQLLLIANVNSHSNICLTVWGFMNITKNSVFSSLGALVTFGALFQDL
ncbi:uncharacterized protein TNCT_342521 [Trichonephila clavata]|uniref:Gustatory receptor n=1 Tax=Trichonephila clavata TaxID=2740835 RepID=A0A8X6FJ37_TRICU|nr:uncharacterized protein TNCT_342521 [Trichonephila clavata]